MVDCFWFDTRLNSTQGDDTTCGYIRSEAQYEVWAAQERSRQEAAAVIESSVEGLADLRHELNQVKQRLDSVVTEVWEFRNQQCKKEPGNRKWQVVVDFSFVATMLVGVLIGVLASLFWK